MPKKMVLISIPEDIIKDGGEKVSIEVNSNLKLGDYVFVSKYSDGDPHDPWCVGVIDEIGMDRKGGFVRCTETSNRYWRNVVKITKETGEKILNANNLKNLYP